LRECGILFIYHALIFREGATGFVMKYGITYFLTFYLLVMEPLMKAGCERVCFPSNISWISFVFI